MNDLTLLGRTALIADALVSGLDRFPQDLAYLYTTLDYLHIAAAEECQIHPFREEQLRSPDGSMCSGRVQFGPIVLDVCATERSTVKRVCSVVRGVRQFTERRFPAEWRRMFSRLSGAAGSWQPGGESGIFGASRDAPSLTQALIREVVSAAGDAGQNGQRHVPQIDFIIPYALAVGDYVLAGLWSETDNATSDPSGRLRRAVSQAFQTGLVGWAVDTDSAMFAVPCVVGSVPWAVAAIKIGAHDWRTAYTLYRDILPRTLEQVRATVRLQYIRTVIEIVDTELAYDTFDHFRLNRTWNEAAASFPFRTPQIREVAADEAESFDLRGRRWTIEPSANPFFPARIGDAGGASWGDLDQLAPLLTSSLRSRLELGQRDRRQLAQDIAHEFKNLSTGLALAAADLWRRTQATLDLPAWVDSGIQAITSYGRQLNAVSLTLYMLARDSSAFQFEASLDAPRVMQAAARVMLHLRSCVDLRFSVEDPFELREALDLLQTRSNWRRRGRRGVSDMVADENVALLLFAVAEPVRNIREASPLRIAQDQSIKVWTQLDDDGSVLIHQLTLEHLGADLELVSEGTQRVNALLPKNFCLIDPIIRPFEGANPEALENSPGVVRVHRYTRIRVFGVPIPSIKKR